MNYRLYLLLLLFCANGLVAQAQETLTISANYEDQALSEVLKDLENRYSLYFYYDADFPIDKKVTAQLDSMVLPTAILSILNDSNLSFEQYDTHSIILGTATKLGNQYNQDFFQARQSERNRISERTPETAKSIYVVGDANNPKPSGKIKIKGFINDDKTGETLIGATMLIGTSGLGTVSDETGQYELDLPIGEHIITISSIGYEEVERILQVYSDDNLDLKLTKEAIELGEVVVEAKALDQNVKSTNVGLETLSAKEIKKLPAFLGEADVIKTIQLLPGVSTVGEGASGFNVRGGNVDQNLTLQDGMLFFNTAHALGLFSLFNPDFVKSVNLYKGSMPAKYGGRLSSVLDVELKDGNYQKFTGQGGIGLVSSRLSLEMPIVEGKSSIILGGRTSYSDWIFNVINVQEVRESAASFYDANVKIAQRFGGNGKLSLSLYRSSDNFRFATESDFNWATSGANVEFSYLLKDNLSMSVEAVVSDYNSSLADPDGNDAFDLKNGILYYGLQPDFLMTLGQHTVNFGGQWRRYEIAQGELSPGNDFSTVIPKKLPTELGREVAVYVQDDFEINDRLSLSAGLRFSLYQSLGPDEVFTYEEGVPRTTESITGSLSFGSGDVIKTYSGLEPRVSLKIGLDDASSFKLSYNKTQQFINQITNTTAVSPVDLWQLSNLNIEPTTANNYSAGFFKNFANNKWVTSAEVFYRDIDNLIEYKERADILVNDHIETELLSGIGRAYGLEVSIRKAVGRWNGLLGYTLSRSERRVEGNTLEETINRGDWFPSNFDQLHNLSLVWSYQISKRSNFSFNFIWSSGRPITAPIGKFGVENVLNIANYSDRNQFRIPDYHRLDVSYTLDTNHKKDKKWEGSWTISLFNVYGRRNPFTVFFSQRSFQAPKANRLAILGAPFPSLTYNFKFL